MAKHRLFDAKRRDGWLVRMGSHGKFYSEYRGLIRFSGASFHLAQS